MIVWHNRKSFLVFYCSRAQWERFNWRKRQKTIGEHSVFISIKYTACHIAIACWSITALQAFWQSEQAPQQMSRLNFSHHKDALYSPVLLRASIAKSGQLNLDFINYFMIRNIVFSLKHSNQNAINCHYTNAYSWSINL